MTLTELAERAEKATGPDRELDACIAEAAGEISEDYQRATHYGEVRPYFWHKWEREGEIIPQRYTASIDAAMSLVPKGWGIAGCSTNGAGCAEVKLGVFGKEQTVNGWGYSPALALVAAALRAREAK